MTNLRLSWRICDGRLTAKWSEQPEARAESHCCERLFLPLAGGSCEYTELAETECSQAFSDKLPQKRRAMTLRHLWEH